MSILLALGTIALLFVSVFLVLIVLMQKSSASGGLGTTFGGGLAEGAWGADTGNILTKSTIYLTITFFVLSFGLYLGNMAFYGEGTEDTGRDIETLVPEEEEPEGQGSGIDRVSPMTPSQLQPAEGASANEAAGTEGELPDEIIFNTPDAEDESSKFPILAPEGESEESNEVQPQEPTQPAEPVQPGDETTPEPSEPANAQPVGTGTPESAPEQPVESAEPQPEVLGTPEAVNEPEPTEPAAPEEPAETPEGEEAPPAGE